MQIVKAQLGHLMSISRCLTTISWDIDEIWYENLFHKEKKA